MLLVLQSVDLTDFPDIVFYTVIMSSHILFGDRPQRISSFHGNASIIFTFCLFIPALGIG